MPWLPELLAHLRALVAAGRGRFTYKALRELAALDLGLDDMVLYVRVIVRDGCPVISFHEDEVDQ